MPLAEIKKRTFTGRTAGQSPTADFSSVTGDVRYVLDGTDMGITTANQATGTAAYGQDNSAGDTKFGQATMAFKFVTGGAPSTAMEILAGRDSTNPNTKAASLLASTSRGIRPRGGADAAVTGWTSDYVCADNVMYIFSIAIEIGTTTSNGKTKAKLTTLADPSTILAQGEGLAFNNGLLQFSNMRYGKQGSTGTLGMFISAIAFNDAAYAYLDLPTDPAVISSELVWDGAVWR